MAERSAWRFVKRALAQRLRAWADEVLQQTEGVVTAPSPGAPQPQPAAYAAAAAIDDDDDRPPAEWLEYIRRRAPHLIADGRFRPSQQGGLPPHLSQHEPAPRSPADGAGVRPAPRTAEVGRTSHGERRATRPPPPATSTDRAPTIGGRAPVGGPSAGAAAPSARAVWPRGRGPFVAADATNATGERAEADPTRAEAPAIADTAWPPRARRSDHDVPSLDRPRRDETPAAPATARFAPPLPPATARFAPPLPPPPPLTAAVAASSPRARAAGEPPASTRTPAPAPRDRRHDIAPPPARPAGAPPHSSSEPRDLWPTLPSLAPSDPDDLARDVEARDRRARLRREQVGTP